MRVIVADPPIAEIYPADQHPVFFEQILRGIAEKRPILYAWGDVLYNPRGALIPPELMVHEKVHLEQQAGDPKVWWCKYIDDPHFRLEQELPAHRAEYSKLKAITKDRNKLVVALHRVAQRLSSPLYGSMIEYEHAMTALKGGEVTPGYRDQPALRHQRQRFRPTAD